MSGIVDPFLGTVRDDGTAAPAMTAAMARASAAQRAAFAAQALGQVATFAALLAIQSPQAGWRAVVAAPVIAGGPGYTRWVHDGSVWRLDGPQDLLVDTTPTVPAGGGTAEQVLRSIALPAGLLASLRYMRVAMVMGKSASTETGTVRLRLGSAGTTADVSVGQASYAAGNRQLSICHEGFASASTQWRAKVNGFVAPVSGGYGTSSIYPINYTIPATSGALSLSITAAMSASTEIPSIVDLIILGG